MHILSFFHLRPANQLIAITRLDTHAVTALYFLILTHTEAVQQCCVQLSDVKIHRNL